MNLKLTLIIGTEDQRIMSALAAMLPGNGRPVFVDEVNADWLDVYEAIELIFPPDELVRKGNRLHAQWYETEYSADTLKTAIEASGANVQFVQCFGELDAESDDDAYTYCYLNIDGKMRGLTSANFSILLPNSKLTWHDDPEKNVRQIVKYLMKSQ